MSVSVGFRPRPTAIPHDVAEVLENQQQAPKPCPLDITQTFADAYLDWKQAMQ